MGNVDRGSIQSWNATIERGCRGTSRSTSPMSAPAGNGGYADLDINAPTGWRRRCQPAVCQHRLRPDRARRAGPQRDLKSWGGRLETRYHALQVGVNRPFTKGLLLKGAYTLSKSENMADDDGWVGLTFNTPSQVDRNYAHAGYDRPHNFQMGFVYQLPLRGSGGVRRHPEG